MRTQGAPRSEKVGAHTHTAPHPAPSCPAASTQGWSSPGSWISPSPLPSTHTFAVWDSYHNNKAEVQKWGLTMLRVF